jgi:hypothetical protein
MSQPDALQPISCKSGRLLALSVLLGNKRFDGIGVSIHHYISLRHAFNIFIPRRTRRLLPDGLDNALGKFDG